MKFLADFHIHSSFSRATAKNITPEEMYKAAIIKGIYILGTGDCIHPEWLDILNEKLEPAEPGLFKLKNEFIPSVPYLSESFRRDMRFVLTTEISTIYKKNGRVRKVHSLIVLPNFESAYNLSQRLSQIGNIISDGRPILGLDTQKLLNICMDINDKIMFIPAHIWTPHFSVFGSNSGFDSLEECFEEDTKYIFALETGLSSDPKMNWRLSKLDNYTLVSNSDAHSLEKIAREANIFDIESPDYYKMREALINKNGFLGTIEFYPEEGKYHLDGHRSCNVCFSPKESKKNNNLCPVCGKKLTIGVLHRVEELADREEGFIPEKAKPFYSIVPLKEVIAEYLKCRPQAKKVSALYNQLIQKFGPEYFILHELPIHELKSEIPELAFGIENMRNNSVKLQGGYDGVYGVIKVLEKSEQKENKTQQLSLF